MEKRVISLGFFDGVHLGHGALLKKTISRAAQLNATPAVLTFSTFPGAITGKVSQGLINTSLERTQLIKKLYGINDIILWNFDQALMHMPWKDFILRTVGELGAVHFIAGYDYRFGYKGEGDAEKLVNYSSELGCGCDIIHKVSVDDETVSSTLIRSLISTGDVERAAKFLGHYHCMSARVESGYQLGRKLGIPTVNQHFSKEIVLPSFGVYASRVEIDGKYYAGVTNVGVRPTVTEENIPKAETHILGYSGDLYGKELLTEFCKFLRPEKRFSSVEDLKNQILTDIEQAKAFFIS